MAAQREWYEKDYYAVLGVAQSAEPKEITKAYRKLARENHPDAKPGDDAAEERFKEISTAYDVLSDETKRREYDEVRRLGPMGGAGMGNTRFTTGAILVHSKICFACFQVVERVAVRAAESVRVVVPILKRRSHLISMMQFWV